MDCVFKNCNFASLSLGDSTLRDCQFHASKLTGINFSETRVLSGLFFKDCKLDFSVFNTLKIPGSQFLECSLKSVDFSEADLKESLFCDSHLLEACFNNADLKKADFRGAKNYIIDPRHTQLKEALFSFPEALALLKTQDIIIEGF